MAYINLGQVVWPVGAIYTSSSNISPANLFGGTWKKVDDEKFWLPSNTSLTYGGENEHKLTVAEMPSHKHGFAGRSNTIAYPGNSWAIEYLGTENHDAFIYPTGGNAAHNNIPAYRTCYCWYRIS